MKKITIKLFTLIFLFTAISFSSTHIFATNDFEIIPQATEDVGDHVTEISVGGEVRDRYDERANDYQENGKLGEAFASGVFTWSLILDYLVYLVRFLSQIGILIGALMIIYAGYIYASSIFTGKESGGGKTAITNAIIGVLVVAFSYAIMKLITSAFIT